MKLKHMWAALKMIDPLAMLAVARDWQVAVRMHFLFAAGQAGLLAALSEPRTRDELVDLLDVRRPEILDALVDVGLAVGELGRRGDAIRLKGRRARILSRPEGDPMAALIEANVTYYNRIYRGTAARLRGGPDEDCLAEIGGVVARFSSLAEPMIRDAIAEAIPPGDSLRMLDVGCGSGDYLRAVAAMSPSATGVGLEIDPDVADLARCNLGEWGIGERFEIACGDIRACSRALAGPFQLITMINVAYYFEEAERSVVFRTIREMLAPGGRFLLVNSMQHRGKDFGSANLNLATASMRGCTPLPDREQLVEQLEASGFERATPRRLASQNAFWAIVAE